MEAPGKTPVNPDPALREKDLKITNLLFEIQTHLRDQRLDQAEAGLRNIDEELAALRRYGDIPGAQNLMRFVVQISSDYRQQLKSFFEQHGTQFT